MPDFPDISIVVPVYGSDDTLGPLYERIAAVFRRISAGFEIIFVDDCGPGNPWKIINEMARRDPRVRGVKLSRNFGQHSAIMAGLDLSRGRWIVIMDCDLQDSPADIPRLWEKAQEGYDVVIGRRVERRDGFFKRLFSDFFHRVFRYMTDRKSDTAQANFGIYSREAIDTVRRMPERPGILPLLVRLAGYEVGAVDVDHCRRAGDKSGYTFMRRLSLAMNILMPCSDKPLRKWAQFWFFMSFASLLCAVGLFLRQYLFDYSPARWTGLSISLFSLCGFFFFGTGAVGIYIRRIFNPEKEKPLYIVQERTQVF